MAGVEFGGDADEALVELLDAAAGERFVEQARQAVAADQAAAGEIEVEQAEDAATGEAAGEFLEVVEGPGDIAAADHGADRGAGDDVGVEAGFDQGPNDADMGPAAGGAAAERQADADPPGRSASSATMPVPGVPPRWLPFQRCAFAHVLRRRAAGLSLCAAREIIAAKLRQIG